MAGQLVQRAAKLASTERVGLRAQNRPSPIRHVARRHFFVQDAVAGGLVTVPHVKSELNLADALTKLLPNVPKFRWAASRLHSWTMAL